MPAGPNEGVLRRAVDAINRNALDELEELLTADFVRHDLASAWPGVSGADGARDFVSQLRDALDGFAVEIVDAVEQDDRLAVQVRISGTHNGELLGIAATGRPIDYREVNIYRFEDGRIAETWQLADIWGLMQQMGANLVTA